MMGVVRNFENSNNIINSILRIQVMYESVSNFYSNTFPQI
jgi:hypothetical protein